MEIKICKNCKRMFKYVFGPELCQDCIALISKEDIALISKEEDGQNSKKNSTILKPLIAEEEEKFEQVKDYIVSHPRASVVQISEANNIKPKKLYEWIREDRLEFSEESKYAWFECAKCGAKIKSGTLCNRCKTYN